MATFLVIGLGRFGSSLALRLMERGQEVMVVDRDEEIVEEIAPFVTQAKIADCMDEAALRSLGVESFDVCFVCTSEQFQSSMEITSLLKEFGAPFVVAKAERDLHARLLRKIGADEVVFPERDMAQRTAMRYSVNGALEYVELSDGFAIFELEVPASWDGKTLIELDLRRRCHVNVIGTKENGVVRPIPSADYVLHVGQHILVAGENRDVVCMMER